MTTKVQAEFLAAGIISDQTQVSAADADHVLIFDASDNSLKKALVSTITSSGTTLKENNLRVISDGQILESSACLFTTNKIKNINFSYICLIDTS